MGYDKTIWVNGVTDLNQGNMNNMEDQIGELSNPDTLLLTSSNERIIDSNALYDAPVVDLEIEGNTVVNIVDGKDILNGNSVSFQSILNDEYYDSLNNVVLIGTGAVMSATNNSGSTADMMIIHMNVSSLDGKTASEMSTIVGETYFEGFKHTDGEVVSIGKNLFDIDDPTMRVNDLFVNNISGIITFVAKTKSIIVEAKEGEIYSLSKTGGDRNVYAFLNELPYSGLTSLAYGEGFTTSVAPTGTKYLLYYVANVNTDFPIQIMLNKGSVVLPHEPFKQSIAPLPRLKRIPSISDTLTTINLKELELVESNISNFATFVNIQRFYISKPIDGIMYGNLNNYESLLEGFKYADSVSDDVSSEYRFTASADNNSLIAVVPLNTYATLEEVQADMNGKQLIYQLATPIPRTKPSLTAYEGGSIYFTGLAPRNFSCKTAQNEGAQRDNLVEGHTLTSNRTPVNDKDSLIVDDIGWSSNSNIGIKGRFEKIIVDSRVRQSDGVDISPTTDEENKINLLSTTFTDEVDTFNGYYKIYANNIPQKPIKFDVRIMKG